MSISVFSPTSAAHRPDGETPRTAGQASAAGEEITLLVARQPVFDGADRLVGYELLYRANADADRATGTSVDRMSQDVIATAFVGIGVREITGGALAFLNVSEQQLLDGTWRLFDPQDVAFELLETVPRTPEIVAICREIVAAGYGLALDDFVYDASYEPLLALGPIVKINVLAHDEATLPAMIAQVRRPGVRVLAECIETEAMHRTCRGLGFDLFQGYFYARPETVVRKEPPLAQLTIMRLLNMLRYPDVTDSELDEAFSNDPALCYKLLRLVNNAGTGQRGIESIGHAIRLVGRDMLHRWLALLLVSSLVGESGTRGELALQAMTRARFCELVVSRRRGTQESGSAFIVGLLSLLDSMMRMPMADVLSHVDLSEEIRAALLSRAGQLAEPLALAEAHERLHFDTLLYLAQRQDVTLPDVGRLQLAAMKWARERLLPGL